jgi:hypothetical protein
MPTADHEIDLKIQTGPDGKPYAVLLNMPTQMKMGETVHFRSADGLVTVKYNKRDQDVPPSKFRSPFVHDGTDHRRRWSKAQIPPEAVPCGQFFRCLFHHASRWASPGWLPTWWRRRKHGRQVKLSQPQQESSFGPMPTLAPSSEGGFGA